MRIFLTVIVCVLLAGCKTTEFVQVPVISRDTLYISTHSRDSIWLHDSILIREKGDTFWVEKWHTKFVEKVVSDTVYKSRVDTVGVPYPIKELVARELSWWQKALMWMGGWFMGLIGVVGVWVVCIKTRR